ncbi:CPBP family intramembrane glutamic endopeptidase [Brachybacterium sp. NPDC056505]|uniref:CPBP family intramembrane glutamic endopeptidase n=1 Tax=Brachybacterium sp. NPDC056505 TaxID=3345843 RepID=UPI00366B6FF9
MSSTTPPPALRPTASRDPSPTASIDRSDRRRWLQLILGVVLFLVAEVVMGAVSVLASVLAGGDVADGPAPWAFLLGGVLAAAVGVGGFLLIVGPVGRSPGLALRGPGKLAELVVGLVIGTVLISLSVALIALLGGYRVTGISPSPQLLAPLAIGIGAGFVEEIFFRGILLRLIDAWMGSWGALVLTSLVFGLIHLTNDGASLASALGLVVEAGILLGAAYLLTRRLWLAIGIHIAWNAVQAGVFSSVVSGTGQQEGLLLADIDGPTWLTGGSMGVEGSLVTVLVGLAAGLVMLVLAVRRGRMLGPVSRRERDGISG